MLILLVAHTGFHMGHNLNMALMISFLGLNLVGALAGIFASMESTASGEWATRARRLRPAFTLAHIILFWPLPVLLVFHVLLTFYY